MTTFITKSTHDVLWAQPYPELGIDLTGHRGVTKVLSFGEKTFVERLAFDRGISLGEAQLLADSYSTRGTDMHSLLEENPLLYLPEDITSQLGTCVASEVMCWGTWGDAKIYGFIDAIWQRPNGDYVLVDYKTKGKPIRYAVDEKSLTAAYKQMSVYAACVKQCYDIQMTNLAVVFIFMNQSGAETDSKLYQVDREGARLYLNQAFKKVKEYSDYVSSTAVAA